MLKLTQKITKVNLKKIGAIYFALISIFIIISGAICFRSFSGRVSYNSVISEMYAVEGTQESGNLYEAIKESDFFILELSPLKITNLTRSDILLIIGLVLVAVVFTGVYWFAAMFIVIKKTYKFGRVFLNECICSDESTDIKKQVINKIRKMLKRLDL